MTGRVHNLWAPWRYRYIMGIDKNPDAECVFCVTSEPQDGKEGLILYRGERVFVVMNKFPYNNGHLMIVPYAHCSAVEELDPATLTEMMRLVSVATQALRQGMNAQGFNIGMNQGRVAGAGIHEHLHMHVVPRWGGDTNFMPVLGQTKVISQDMQDTIRILRDQFRAITQEPPAPPKRS